VSVALGFAEEIAALERGLAAWIGDTSEEIRPALDWQFGVGSKRFRPVTAFSCYRAIYQGPIPPEVIRSASVVEMFHNVSLIIDDILDDSPERRGRPSLHARFGTLTALMTSGCIVADGYRLVQNDPHDIRLFSELLMRLGTAECLQWRLRQQALGVEDWRRIAAEDTGSMFEVCACLGTRTEELRQFGHLLGVLYHGCDDVADIRGAAALGGGGDEDLRDGILTLPAAVAIRDPEIARVFTRPHRSADDIRMLAAAFTATVPEAETYLDSIADDACAEAERSALNPGPLLALVHQTRQLSHR
jgi:geranylgeranyl pyrophosphate synthase